MSYGEMIDRQLRETQKSWCRRQLTLSALGLRGQSKLVADYIVHKMSNNCAPSVGDIASQVSASPSTVRRTLKLLGITDLSSLVESAESEAAETPQDDQEQPLLFADHAEQMLTYIYDTFHELQAQADNIAEAARLLKSASLVQIYGSVLSAGVGMVFQEKLSALQLPCRFSADTGAVLRTLQQLVPGGVLFCVSLIGATTHMGVRVLNAAKSCGVKSILLTNCRSSLAARTADVVLTTGIANPTLHHTDLLARGAQLFALDVLAKEISALSCDLTKEGV